MPENFRRNFSPGPTDCPRVSEDEGQRELYAIYHEAFIQIEFSRGTTKK